MNNNNKDNSNTIALDEPSLSETSLGYYDSYDSMRDMETFNLEPLGYWRSGWRQQKKELVSTSGRISSSPPNQSV
eukprot:13055591-Ditylum_brightwellii.AAC.1